MEFTADQVWGAAVAADRINGGYFKEDIFVLENQCQKRTKEANKTMVRGWLRTQDFAEVTEVDIAQGRAVRHFFNGLLLKELSGKINSFERMALGIAQMEEFTGKNLLEFAIISCLPAAMLREQDRKELDSEIRSSTQLEAAVGDTIVGDIDVYACSYNQDYNKFRVRARMGEAFIDFWFGENLAKDSTVRVKGKVKSIRSDKTTQLNYVKRA
jgi:hypothetical protein